MQQLQAEATRRGSSLGGSNVASQPNPSASQPLQGGQPPIAEGMYKGGADMMQKAQPNESNIILKALIKRLNANPVGQ